MSLREKLSQKKAVQEQASKAKKIADFQQKLEEVQNELAALKAKKDKIAELRIELQTNYKKSSSKLAKFKTKKEDLQKIYDEFFESSEVKNGEAETKNFSVEAESEEAVIKNVQDLIKANPKEKEVKAYHLAGQKGRKAVSKLSVSKTSLKSELADLDLNFSGGKKPGETESPRDLSFAKIAKYLADLDSEITNLEKKETEFKEEIPQNKKELISQDLLAIDKNMFSEVQADNLENFHLNYQTAELGEKYGEDSVQEVLKVKLTEKLENEVLANKSPEFKTALEDNQKFKDILNIKNLDSDIDKIVNLKMKATTHLVDLLEDKPELKKQLSRISGLAISDSREQVKVLINHLFSLNNFPYNNFTDFIKYYDKYKRALNIRDFREIGNNFRSEDYFEDALKNYSLFYQDIINNKLEGFEDLAKKSGSAYEIMNKGLLYNRSREDSETSPEELADLKSSKYKLALPQSLSGYDLRGESDFFQEAYQKSIEASRTWEEEKESIAQAAETSIKKEWSQNQDEYYKNKYQDLINKLEEDKKYCEVVSKFLIKAKSFPTDLKERLLKLAPSNYDRRLNLFDANDEEEYKKYKEEVSKLAKKKDDILGKIVFQLEQKAQKAKNSLFGSKKKGSGFEQEAQKLQKFLKNNFDNLEPELVNKFFPEDQKQLTEINQQYFSLKKQYDDYQKGSMKIATTFSDLDFEAINDDFLAAKKLKIADLVQHYTTKRAEKEGYLYNLPSKEQEIIDQIAENKKRKEEAERNFKRKLEDY